MDYRELKSVEMVKLLKEKTDDSLTILEINEIINYLLRNHLLNDIQEVNVYSDHNLFLKEALTEIKSGDDFQVSKERQIQIGYHSKYSVRKISIISQSSDTPIEIGKNNDYRTYNISTAGNAYLNRPENAKEDGNFDLNSNIATLVFVQQDNIEFAKPKTKYSIGIYLGKKRTDSESDIAISYILRSLNFKREIDQSDTNPI